MKVVINNSKITLTDYNSEQKRVIASALTYTDKSKQFELRRLSKWYGNNHPKIVELRDQVTGQLYEEINGSLVFSSSFFDMIDTSNVVDLRQETGATVYYPWKDKPFDLRDYQEEAVKLMEDKYRGLINLATGLGKTLIAVHAVKRIKKKTLIICPGESVAKQFYDALCDALGSNKVAYYGGGKKKIGQVTVGIAASINNDINILKNEEFGLVIFDEVHHIAANTFFKISEHLSNTWKMFGLTATDYRSDGKDVMIKAGVGPVLVRRDIRWGVENGWLAKPVFIVKNVNTQGRSFSNDKLKNYKEHILNNDLMKDTIKADIRAFLNAGKQVLCIVSEVSHGKQLSEHFGAEFATGLDKKSQSYVKLFNQKKIPLLIGTSGKISEGTDTTSTEVLILANFVASKGPVIQAVGRGLRRVPGKDSCIIVDYIPQGSDMLMRHALGRIKFYKEITNKVKII